ncbi:O-methyltransferase [Pseudonocardiaceae bacterium YIM PH 21723]|nr:O-methyltransferase [Pseudonocardiaceae bacterium YIM PH 21723]
MTCAPVTADSPQVQSYVDEYLREDEILQAARARGQELGCVPIAPAGGATLRFIAATLQARTVVEVGTGAGVSGLWLLRGMAADGVLTSIDVEPENQRAAKATFVEAGIPGGRTRLILGQALDVLPRLTDSAYDLVFVDALKTEYPQYLEEAIRLLRIGGVVAIDNILWHGRVADPSQRDAATMAVREVARLAREDDRLTPVMLPVGDGLLAATRVA